MPRAGWVWLALPVLALGHGHPASAQTAATADSAAKAALERCIAQQRDDEVSGLEDFEQDCPGLSAALQEAGLRPLILDDSGRQFERASLQQLSRMVRPATGPAPGVASLPAILRELRATPPPARSWWQRFLDWLGEHFAPKGDPGGAASWLSGLAKYLSRLQWLWTGIIWVTCIALPIAVAVIVVREVRAMGRRSLDERGATDSTASPGRLESRLALLRRTPPGRRPAPLFALLVGRLVAAGRLPPDRSLTHREVLRRARLDDADQRRLLESLARLSERQLYAESIQASAGLEEMLARGEDLYTTGWSGLPEQSP